MDPTMQYESLTGVAGGFASEIGSDTKKVVHSIGHDAASVAGDVADEWDRLSPKEKAELGTGVVIGGVVIGGVHHFVRRSGGRRDRAPDPGMQAAAPEPLPQESAHQKDQEDSGVQDKTVDDVNRESSKKSAQDEPDDQVSSIDEIKTELSELHEQNAADKHETTDIANVSVERNQDLYEVLRATALETADGKQEIPEDAWAPVFNQAVGALGADAASLTKAELTSRLATLETLADLQKEGVVFENATPEQIEAFLHTQRAYQAALNGMETPADQASPTKELRHGNDVNAPDEDGLIDIVYKDPVGDAIREHLDRGVVRSAVDSTQSVVDRQAWSPLYNALVDYRPGAALSSAELNDRLKAGEALEKYVSTGKAPLQGFTDQNFHDLVDTIEYYKSELRVAQRDPHAREGRSENNSDSTAVDPRQAAHETSKEELEQRERSGHDTPNDIVLTSDVTQPQAQIEKEMRDHDGEHKHIDFNDID